MATSLDRLLLLLLLATPLLSQVATTADSSTTTPCIEKGDMKECVNATIVQPEGKSITFDKEDLQQDVIDRWTASKTELTGGFIIKASKYIKHLKFPKLEKIKYLTIEHLVNLETIELPVLKSVSVGLVILGNPSLKTIYINPKAVGGTLSIGGNGQLDQTSIAKWNMLKMDNTSHVQEFRECSSDILYSTSELAHCSLLNFHCLGNAGNATIEGGMPEGVKEEGIEVSCVTFDKTNLTTLAFVKVRGTNKNNRNVLTNNPLLCDEGLVEKFNVTARQPAWKHYIHSNCDAICDTHELHNPADADQLIKCTIFRDNKSPIGEEQLNNKMPQVTHIQGKVELNGTSLKDLSLLQNIQEIDSKHDLALEIVDNKELDQINLPKLKTLKSNGSVKLRIRGNKKLLDKDVYEKLKEQLGLEDEEMETDYVVPTTTAEASSLPFASGLGSGKINGSSSTGKKVAIVIGIVIVLLMLLALVGSLVYWFVIKKKLQKKKAQEEKKDGEKKVQRSLKQTTKSVEQASKSGLARGEVMNTIGKSTEQANNKTA